jgi:hypothetical protein
LGSTAALGTSAIAGASYAALLEPRWLALERVEVPIDRLSPALDGFTIAQLSDLHRGPDVSAEEIRRAAQLALRQETNLIVLTGDYVSSTADHALSCAQALTPLAEASDVLACLGNHDHWTDASTVAGVLTDAGVMVLRNEARAIREDLWVAAVDDVWERHADLEEALAGIPLGATVILLAHEPDYADVAAADRRVKLQLSGHTHGGQVQLPIVGAPILPYLGQKYPAGRFRVGAMWLYVNRGVGLISPPVRFNCRPEVTLLTLRHRAK